MLEKLDKSKDVFKWSPQCTAQTPKLTVSPSCLLPCAQVPAPHAVEEPSGDRPQQADASGDLQVHSRDTHMGRPERLQSVRVSSNSACGETVDAWQKELQASEPHPLPQSVPLVKPYERELLVSE